MAPSYTRRLGFVLLLAPVMIVLIGVFLVPMLLMFLLSLQDENSRFTLANYWIIFQDSYYWGVLWRTIRISVLTSVVTLVFAYPIAAYMAKCSGTMRGIITLVVLIPHLVSVVIRNFGWTIVLSERGLVNNALLSLGLIERSLRLMYNELGTIIGLADSYIAYMVLAIAASLYAIDPSLYKASSILGATGIRNFFSITLPLSMPGVYSGIVLIFSLSMSAYVTPALLGGSRTKVMSSMTYQEIMFTLNWPLGSAVSFVMLAVTLLMVTIFTKLTETRKYKAVFQT